MEDGHSCGSSIPALIDFFIRKEAWVFNGMALS